MKYQKNKKIPINCSYYTSCGKIFVHLEWYEGYGLFRKEKNFRTFRYYNTSEKFCIISFNTLYDLIQHKKTGLSTIWYGNIVSLDKLRSKCKRVRKGLSRIILDKSLKTWLSTNYGIIVTILHKPVYSAKCDDVYRGGFTDERVNRR